MQKKYLGQHFLKNKIILETMARAANVSGKDVVLEVGAGTGTLTEVLAKYAKKVVAVEKDRDLIPLLREKFRDFKTVEIIEGDILDKKITASFPKNYKIVANIPYYITSHFLKIFLSGTKTKPELMVLMVQKEVAERICAKPPRMNLLALSVRAYAEAEIIRAVSKGQFSPPPKIDSAIIKISNISDKFFKKNKINEKNFFNILRLAFQQKRKMLRQSLKGKLSMSDIDRFGARRPEELSLKEWANIV